MVVGTPIQFVVGAAVAAAMLVAGLLLLVLGLRGRRIDDHPVCRRCRFDLVGALPGAGVCPECGSDLGRRRAVRHGQRRRRRELIAAGAVALVLAPGALVGGYAAAWARWTPYRVLPTTWLVAMVDPDSPSTGAAALRELARRAERGALSPETSAKLVDLALERQERHDLPWSAAWGEPLGAAFAGGALSAEQVERYVRAAMTPSLAIRSPAAAGEDQWPLGFEISGARVGTRSYAHPGIVARLQRVEVGGTALDLTGRGPMTGLVYLHAGVTSSVSHHLPLTAEPGTHRVRAEWLIEMMSTPSSPGAGVGTAVASWPLVLEGEVEVLPPGAPVVTLVADQSMQAQIDAMVVTQGFAIDVTEDPPRADGRFILRGSPPMPLAFDIYWRLGEGESAREWWAGSIVMSTRQGEANVPLYGELDGFDLSATHVNVVLRPSPAAAVRDRGIDRIWDGEVIIRNVPLAQPPAGGSPTAGE